MYGRHCPAQQFAAQPGDGSHPVGRNAVAVGSLTIGLWPGCPAGQIVCVGPCSPERYASAPTSVPASGVLPAAVQSSGSVPTAVHVLIVPSVHTAASSLLPSTSGVRTSIMSALPLHVELPGAPGPPSVHIGNVPPIVMRKWASANTMSP